MSLDTLRIALQGLFPLSAIGAAVQGLIDQIKKERQENNIGGGLKRTSTPRSSPAYADEDIERLVREKWEAVEAAQSADRAQEADKESTRQAVPVEKPPEIEHEVLLALPIQPAAIPDVPSLTAAVDPQATQERRLRRQLEEDAVALMLVELL